MRSCPWMEFRAAKLLFVLLAVPSAGCSRARTFPCDDPGPAQVAGKDTGFVFCTGGPVHRPKRQECPSKLPRATTCEATGENAGTSSCSTDADCKDAPNGFCRLGLPGPPPTCGCGYGCTSDADCGEGNMCLCGDPVGKCVQASCKSDADCHGLLCTQYSFGPSCSIDGFACQNERDGCLIDDDCERGTPCLFDGDHRSCSPPTCFFD